MSSIKKINGKLKVENGKLRWKCEAFLWIIGACDDPYIMMSVFGRGQSPSPTDWVNGKLKMESGKLRWKCEAFLVN